MMMLRVICILLFRCHREQRLKWRWMGGSIHKTIKQIRRMNNMIESQETLIMAVKRKERAKRTKKQRNKRSEK